MNYQDIEKLASLKESNNLEFKESTGQLDRSMETLCAFPCLKVHIKSV